MPLVLKPPRPGKSPNYTVRGTYLGVAVDRSTGTGDQRLARRILRKWEEEIERGAYQRRPERVTTFLDAAVAYMAATGQRQFLKPLVERLGRVPLAEIDQALVDTTAVALYPNASPATRNRQVYTPVQAIRRHNGVTEPLRRPKGWRGAQRVVWLQPEAAFALLAAARAVDAEFGAFLTVMLYTGARLSEMTGLMTADVSLADAAAYFPKTKNGHPRLAHLPPAAVAALANHPRGLDRPGRVFRFAKSGRLYALMAKAKAKAGAPEATFHVLRHTWATWMRRFAGADTTALLATGAWRNPASARRYEHLDGSAESRRADALPVEKTWKTRKGRAK